MKLKIIFYIVVITILFSAVFMMLSRKARAVSSQHGGQVYTTYCGGCHGRQMQGGQATKLIKSDWIYGRHRNDLVRNIRYGIANTDMIAWGKILNEPQIDSVVDYIIRSQKISLDARRPLPKQVVTSDYTISIEPLIDSGIQTPWGIEFVDQHTALLTERPGRIRLIIDGKLDPEPIRGTPPTAAFNTGGYMDIALDPNYSKNGWVYLSYSQATKDLINEHAPAMTKIVRGRIRDHEWKDEETLFEVPDTLKIANGNRWGSRLIFDREGRLYFTIGDMAREKDAQKLDRPAGKIFRINPDGSVPNDNPFVNVPRALPAIFSIGNRNVQGLDFDPITGTLWASEHGPMGGDELNIIKAGANYGWPVITYGIDYSGDTITRNTQQKGMEQPILSWTPSIAVCPILFVTSKLLPKWKNNLLIGALSFEEVRRLVIDGNKVISQEIILKNYGRVRDIKSGPDGAVYILLNNPDMLIRLRPQN